MRTAVLVVTCLVARTAGADVKADVDAAYTAAKDDKARKLALALLADYGDVALAGPDQTMDGNFRGKIHLVPALPTGDDRQHLVWASNVMHTIDGFFTAQFPDKKQQPAYRWTQLQLQFVRSVGKHTPSAFAASWTITYNVAGSLWTSEASALDTLFHELFHLNDEEHKDWSLTALSADYDAIVKKCGVENDCLEPYAPGALKMRGGTYYAFQPDNGQSVHEYAAELAVRYFDEQREVQAHGKLSKTAFKCGPAENARSWKAIVDEFFAGKDLVPACKP